MTKEFSNDATKKILGFEYQKLIALEVAFDAKVNDIVYIECYGDVAYDNTSVEVKHHQTDVYLSSKHEDFWKTLKNWVEEKEITEQYGRLVLHTTSEIKGNSIFYDWQALSKRERLQSLREVKKVPTKGIKPFVETIFGFDTNYTEEDLLGIIQKIEILHSQKKIVEKLKELEANKILSIVPKEFRRNIIEKLHGWVSLKAVGKDIEAWVIEKNEFDRELRVMARAFLQGEVPFPEVSKKEISKKELKNSYGFVDEIKNIKYQSKIPQAVSDYHRANLSLEKILEYSPSLCEHVDNFDTEIIDELKERKDSKSYDLIRSEIDTPKALKLSRTLYDDCLLGMEMKKISCIQPIKSYFQRGRVHEAVEQKEFKWKFEIEDLNEGD